jgi:hypothetical protein
MRTCCFANRDWVPTATELRPFRDPVGHFSAWSVSGWHLRLPLAPLLSALGRARRPAARWGPSLGGALLSPATISVDQGAERSRPIATVMLYINTSQCLLLRLTILAINRLFSGVRRELFFPLDDNLKLRIYDH